MINANDHISAYRDDDDDNDDSESGMEGKFSPWNCFHIYASPWIGENEKAVGLLDAFETHQKYLPIKIFIAYLAL